jgi:hypothetical protein
MSGKMKELVANLVASSTFSLIRQFFKSLIARFSPVNFDWIRVCYTVAFLPHTLFIHHDE